MQKSSLAKMQYICQSPKSKWKKARFAKLSHSSFIVKVTLEPSLSEITRGFIFVTSLIRHFLNFRSLGLFILSGQEEILVQRIIQGQVSKLKLFWLLDF